MAVRSTICPLRMSPYSTWKTPPLQDALRRVTPRLQKHLRGGNTLKNRGPTKKSSLKLSVLYIDENQVFSKFLRFEVFHNNWWRKTGPPWFKYPQSSLLLTVQKSNATESPRIAFCNRNLLGLAVNLLDLARGNHGFDSCRSLARWGVSADSSRGRA